MNPGSSTLFWNLSYAAHLGKDGNLMVFFQIIPVLPLMLLMEILLFVWWVLGYCLVSRIRSLASWLVLCNLWYLSISFDQRSYSIPSRKTRSINSLLSVKSKTTRLGGNFSRIFLSLRDIGNDVFDVFSRKKKSYSASGILKVLPAAMANNRLILCWNVINPRSITVASGVRPISAHDIKMLSALRERGKWKRDRVGCTNVDSQPRAAASHDWRQLEPRCRCISSQMRYRATVKSL